MKILALETYFGGSHQSWLEGLKAHSGHQIEILGLPARNWKWRLHGGAITLADKAREVGEKPDIILSSSMVDTSLFLSLLRKDWGEIPCVTYFHENQFAYPWSPEDQDPETGKDLHYQFIQYASALSSDQVWFNSQYNRDSFLMGVEDLLKKMPDYQDLKNLDSLKNKSHIVPLGFEQLPKVEQMENPVIIWNHRWEFDKNPNDFFQVLKELKEEGFKFQLIVLGQKGRKSPPIFAKAKEIFKDQLLHFGEVSSREEYLKWMAKGNILPVTSHQDFFGISVVEAALMGIKIILPKRLSYPELIPQEKQEKVFYSGETDLKEKIRNWSNLQQEGLAQHFEKYRWNKIGPVMDQKFEQLKN